MSKQGYIEYRRGRAAKLAGKPYDAAESHEWKMGYALAKAGVQT